MRDRVCSHLAELAAAIGRGDVDAATAIAAAQYDLAAVDRLAAGA